MAKLHQKPSPTSLHHLSFVLQQLADELLQRQAGVGLSQVRLMSVLHRTLPRSQRAVAGQVSQTEANVSRQLRQMHKQGLVSIKRNKKDARQRDVILTSKGQQRRQKAERLLRAQQADLMKLLSRSEARAFDRAASHLIQVLGTSLTVRKIIG